MDKDEFLQVVIQSDAVPDYLMSGNGSFEPMPLSERAVTYEGLMELLRRMHDQGWNQPYGPAPDDWFEGVRGEGETRPQAKSRVMLEEYSRQGLGIKDRDLWNLRAQYVWVKSYVQGVGGGLPYNTHNWIHFYNRYGQGGAREPVLMIGLRKDTVAEMARLCAAESEAIRALQILGH